MVFLDYFQITTFALGVLFLIVGGNIERDSLMTIGLILGAASMTSGGVNALLTRRTGFWGRITRSEGYQGHAAVFLGVAFLVAGTWLLYLSAARLLGFYPWLAELLRNRPGVLLLSISIFVLGISLSRLTAWWETPGSGWQMVGKALYHFLDLILVLLGLVAMAVGLLEILLPTAFDQLLVMLF
jgi:hypothetical protein